jgi:hypothetical protein
MSETCITLTGHVARVILLDIANDAGGYGRNEGWNWWAYEAGDGASYPYGHGVAKMEQLTSSGAQLELIISIHPEKEEEPSFFCVRGEESSYGRDKWDAVVTPVKPTARVVRVYE